MFCMCLCWYGWLCVPYAGCAFVCGIACACACVCVFRVWPCCVMLYGLRVLCVLLKWCMCALNVRMLFVMYCVMLYDVVLAVAFAWR